MSTKAKLGKDWVKTQVQLRSTGETLHLTLGPGQTGAPVVAWIDGRMVDGVLELISINNPNPAGPDVTVRLRFPELEKQPVVTPKAAPAPVAPPKPAPTVTVAPAVVEEPAPVEPQVEVASETTEEDAVQEPALNSDAPANKPAGEGRRKKRG